MVLVVVVGAGVVVDEVQAVVGVNVCLTGVLETVLTDPGHFFSSLFCLHTGEGQLKVLKADLSVVGADLS